MIKAVLIDLDDTLLLSSKDAFLQALLQGMMQFFRDELGLTQPRDWLGKAAEQINRNLDPTLTNREIWQRSLTEALPLTADQIEQGMGRFYRDIYPDFQTLTQPDPVGYKLIRWLLDNGYVVIIATNPLYPPSAIEQRIKWAGLGELIPYFSRITHAENSHFTKPQPHYYEEILCHVGLEPYEAIMVGDNWKNDIVPAASAGMRTFWVDDKSSMGKYQTVTPDARGKLAEFAYCAMERGWLESLTPRPIERHQVVPRLLGDVAALMGSLDEMPPHFWNQHPDPDEWSPMEIVAHLEESERTTQRPRLQKIAQEHNPFLTAPKAPFQPGERNFEGADGYAIARQFAAERQQTVVFLESLPQKAWERPARHSIFGPTNLLEMAIFTTRHDQLHIKQLCQTIGKCE